MVHWSFLSKAPKFRGDCKKKHNPVSSRQSGRVHFFLFRHDVKILVGGLEPWNFDDFPFSWEWKNHPNRLSVHHFSEGLVAQPPTR